MRRIAERRTMQREVAEQLGQAHAAQCGPRGTQDVRAGRVPEHRDGHPALEVKGPSILRPRLVLDTGRIYRVPMLDRTVIWTDAQGAVAELLSHPAIGESKPSHVTGATSVLRGRRAMGPHSCKSRDVSQSPWLFSSRRLRPPDLRSTTPSASPSWSKSATWTIRRGRSKAWVHACSTSPLSLVLHTCTRSAARRVVRESKVASPSGPPAHCIAIIAEGSSTTRLREPCASSSPSVHQGDLPLRRGTAEVVVSTTDNPMGIGLLGAHRFPGKRPQVRMLPPGARLPSEQRTGRGSASEQEVL